MIRTRVHRWTLLLILTTLCTGVAVVASSPPVPARAADGVGDDTVEVVGAGSVDAVPDVVRVDFGVRVTRTSVGDALDARSRAVHRLLDALRAQNVDDKDLQTTDVSLYRRHRRHDPTTYYVASESVSATIRTLSAAGDTIDAAATSSRFVDVGGMSFDISDDAALITEARSNAFTDAKDKAQEYADLADRTLGRVEVITENVRNPQPVFYGAAAGSRAGSPATPVAAGTLTVRVRVTVVWQLV
jgi:uncharacterized protein YggE